MIDQPGPDPLRWKALTVVCAAFFMTVLDVSIVNVALPSIGKSLHFSREDLQWVITAYAITFGGFLLLGGRAADLLGRRRVFLAGVTVFTVASLLCGLAWSEGVLIAARAIQGLGAAIISPSALSIVTTTFDEGAERNKALGIWGAIGGSGAAVGVLAGGVLTKYLGWEWIFFVNVPVGAAALLLAPRFVRESRLGERRRTDVPGAVTVTAGLALLVVTRIGVKPVLTTGMALLTAGMLWYAHIPVNGSFWPNLLPGYLAVGVGLPFAFIPVSIAALAGVEWHEAGLASGLINTAQQVGGALGVAIASSVATSHFTTLVHEGTAPPAALTSGFQWAFWLVAGIAAAGIAASLLLIRRAEIPRESEAAPAA